MTELYMRICEFYVIVIDLSILLKLKKYFDIIELMCGIDEY